MGADQALEACVEKGEPLREVTAWRGVDEVVPDVPRLGFTSWDLWLVGVGDYEMCWRLDPPVLSGRSPLDVTRERPWDWAAGRAVVWLWTMTRARTGAVEGVIVEFEHLDRPGTDPLHHTGQLQLLALGGVRVRLVLPPRGCASFGLAPAR